MLGVNALPLAVSPSARQAVVDEKTFLGNAFGLDDGKDLNLRRTGTYRLQRFLDVTGMAEELKIL